MTFTGGSWLFRYRVDNGEFGRWVQAYLNYRRSRHLWAYRIWMAYISIICGIGFVLAVVAGMALVNVVYHRALPRIQNQDLDLFIWVTLLAIVTLGVLIGIRRLYTIVETPEPSGLFEFEVIVDNTGIHARTRGMAFSLDFKSLREFVELKTCFAFVHPMTLLVLIPRRVFPNEAVAKEFAAFCRKTFKDHG